MYLRGLPVDALQHAKRIKGVSLTDCFLETRNDDQVKRLVKAVELNPKSPKKCIQMLLINLLKFSNGELILELSVCSTLLKSIELILL